MRVSKPWLNSHWSKIKFGVLLRLNFGLKLRPVLTFIRVLNENYSSWSAEENLTEKSVWKKIFSKRTLMKLYEKYFMVKQFSVSSLHKYKEDIQHAMRQGHTFRKKTFAEKSLMETGPWIRSWMENLSCSFSHLSNPFLFLSHLLSAWINTLTYILLTGDGLDKFWRRIITHFTENDSPIPRHSTILCAIHLEGVTDPQRGSISWTSLHKAYHFILCTYM